MIVQVMSKCISFDLLAGNLSVNNKPEQNHIIILMKALFKKYFTVWLINDTHHTISDNNLFDKSKFRSHLTMFITFLGQ